jgi:hypothetical protein
MADFPSVRSTKQGTTVTSTSVIVDIPGGAAGDLLLVFVSARAALFTWPAGWTEFEEVDNGPGVQTLGIGLRVADGTEGPTITVTSSSAAFNTTWIVYRISEWHGATLPEKGVAATTAAGTTINPPSLAPSWGSDKTLWIAAAAGLDAGGGSPLSSYPSNYLWNQLDQFSVTQNGVSVAVRKIEAASEDPGVFSYSGGGQFRSANTLAVRPHGLAAVFSDLGGHRIRNRMVGY